MFIIEETDMTFVRGDTISFMLSLKNYNLDVGDKITFTIKKNIDDSIFIIQKNITTFSEGKAFIGLNNVETLIEPGVYVYDVQLTMIGGSVDTVVLPSRLKVLKGVTD